MFDEVLDLKERISIIQHSNLDDVTILEKNYNHLIEYTPDSAERQEFLILHKNTKIRIKQKSPDIKLNKQKSYEIKHCPKEFQIFDRSLSTSSVMSYALPVAPQKMTCDGDYLYILAATAPVLYQVSFN